MGAGQPGIPLIKISGKVGNVVFAHVGDELVVRERVRPANPRTPRQVGARQGLVAAAKRWAQLSDEDFEAWVAYSEAVGRPAYNLFVALTAKFLRMHPDQEPPTAPPAGPFFGDAVRLKVVPVTAVDAGSNKVCPTLGQAEGCSGAGLGLVHQPSACEHPHPIRSAHRLPPQKGEVEPGVVEVAADRPNSAGVMTELLFQPIAHRRRKVKTREWRSAGFVSFVSGGLVVEVPLPAGTYALAYRFVDGGSGQETAMASLGSAVVGV